MTKVNKPKKPSGVKDIWDMQTGWHSVVASEKDIDEQITNLENSIANAQTHLAELRCIKGEVDEYYRIVGSLEQINQDYMDYDDALKRLVKYWESGIIGNAREAGDDGRCKFDYMSDGRFTTESIRKAVASVGGIKSVGLDEYSDNSVFWIPEDIKGYICSFEGGEME